MTRSKNHAQRTQTSSPKRVNKSTNTQCALKLAAEYYTLSQCSAKESKEKGKISVCVELQQAVPLHSVAFDLSRAIHLNPTEGIPGASTIQHGRA